MADLPKERLSQESPFTYCGNDMFGPILVKEGCKEMKRYGCLFTCLSSRAIYIESTNSLSTQGLKQQPVNRHDRPNFTFLLSRIFCYYRNDRSFFFSSATGVFVRDTSKALEQHLNKYLVSLLVII